MNITELDKFNPTVAELTLMVEKTKGLTIDIQDKGQLSIVHTSRIELKNARVKIEKAGKALREEAIAYQKAVIAKEKELVGIIEPEEDRLAAIEEEAEKFAIRKERLEKLPTRKERLLAIPYSHHLEPQSDEVLLDMDANAFEAYLNSRTSSCFAIEQREQQAKIEEEARKHNEALVAAQKKIDAENIAKKAEQDAKDKELADKESGLAEERRKFEQEKEAKAAEEKAREDERVRVAKEAEDKRIAEEEAAKKAAEDKVKADAELATQKKFQEFLISVGMTKENMDEFHKIDTGDTIVVYRKVGTFTK